MSLSGYISEITNQLRALQKSVEELQRENKELKDLLTTSHHRWWLSSTKEMPTTDEMVEDLIQMSNQPDYLKYR